MSAERCPEILMENQPKEDEWYVMECTLEVSRRERLGEAETVKTCNWSGFASLEVVTEMFKMMLEPDGFCAWGERREQ